MKDIRFAKFLVLVNGGVPLVLLGWDALHHNLGANPVNFAILTTGMLTPSSGSSNHAVFDSEATARPTVKMP